MRENVSTAGKSISCAKKGFCRCTWQRDLRAKARKGGRSCHSCSILDHHPKSHNIMITKQHMLFEKSSNTFKPRTLSGNNFFSQSATKHQIYHLKRRGKELLEDCGFHILLDNSERVWENRSNRAGIIWADARPMVHQPMPRKYQKQVKNRYNKAFNSDADAG